MYICGHHTLVASAKAVKIGKEINPDFKIGNMIAMVPIYPFSCRPADQVLAQQQMHDRFSSAMYNVVDIILLMP